MFGFVIGALSLLGFIKVWRWNGEHRRHGSPRQWMLRRLFERLDTSPGQEKVISDATAELERTARELKEALKGSRQSLAKLMGADHFDHAALSADFEAQQKALEEVKKSLRTGLAAIHEVLLPEQRRRLATLIEEGPRGMHGRHRCGRYGHSRGPSTGSRDDFSQPQSL